MAMVRGGLGLILFVLAMPAAAAPQRPCGDDAGRMSSEIAEAFSARSMTRLADGLPRDRFDLVVDHSLSDERSRIRVRMPGFEAAIARMERSDGRSEPLARAVLEGRSCERDVCRFGPSGILHNHLYLAEIAFVRRRGCLAVSRIRLLNGD